MQSRSRLFILILPALLFLLSFENTPEGNNLINPALTRKLYELNGRQLVWMKDDADHAAKRKLLTDFIDSCRYLGLTPGKYHQQALKRLSAGIPDSGEAVFNADQFFTDAALAISKDLKTGEHISRLTGHDELSGKCVAKDEQALLETLSSLLDTTSLNAFFRSLEPTDHEYLLLRQELQKQLALGNQQKIRQLRISLNYHRWISHFNADAHIVVNIMSTTLRYYRNDSMVLSMKTVVGKPSTRTPRFAAYCDKIILYPYWNVPASIVPELLPSIRRNPRMLQAMNLQVIDGKGRVISPGSVNWKAYGNHNFPYRLRQSTGCGNALGVIKFNLTSPFAVYMHDTNVKSVFTSDYRYLSHGCIRLEKPVELGNYLLPGKISNDFLATCLKNQEPVTMYLDRKVPVFVIYMPCQVNDSNEVVYFRDIYKLL